MSRLRSGVKADTGAGSRSANLVSTGNAPKKSRRQCEVWAQERMEELDSIGTNAMPSQEEIMDLRKLKSALGEFDAQELIGLWKRNQPEKGMRSVNLRLFLRGFRFSFALGVFLGAIAVRCDAAITSATVLGSGSVPLVSSDYGVLQTALNFGGETTTNNSIEFFGTTVSGDPQSATVGDCW